MIMAKVMEYECRIQDKAFEKTGVEQEELEENLMHFMKDPEVSGLMQMLMMKI